jgi:alcohol dehydrogenase class IV
VCSDRLDNDAAAADAFVSCIDELARSISIPVRLRDLGVRREQIPALVAGSRGNSMGGNPREISDAELAALLESRL